MVNRRAFLGALAAAAAGAAFDPERLLWVPGAKTIFLPPEHQAVFPAFAQFFKVGDVITIEGRYAMHPVTRRPTSHLQEWIVTEAPGTTTVLTVKPHEPRPLGPNWKRGHVTREAARHGLAVNGAHFYDPKTPRSGWVRR